MRYLITVTCLFAALYLYSVGDMSTAGLVLLGVAFETAFWVRLSRLRRPR